MTSTVVMTIKSSLSAEITWDDATWILSCSFIIFTMQTGKRCICVNKIYVLFNRKINNFIYSVTWTISTNYIFKCIK